MNHLTISGKHILHPKAKSTSCPPASIQVKLHQADSNIDPLDLSFSSQEDYPFHIMGRSSSNNCGGDKRSRSPTSSPQSTDESKRRIELENIEQHEKEWATLFERTKVAPELRNIERDISPDVANNNNKDNINNPTNPFAAADALGSVIQPSSVADEPSQPKPKSILRRRLSSSSLTSSMHQKRQAAEIQSILQTLEELQNNFVTNDNSFVSTTTSGSWDDGATSTSDTNGEQPTTIKHQKEFTTISYPNGNLFSGTINSSTQQLIYGRMTCALEMEVYEGPFNKHGKRHGEGAVCTKIDGTAKFLGRYVLAFCRQCNYALVCFVLCYIYGKNAHIILYTHVFFAITYPT